ncbi:hypothetical protein GQ43DRAFT_5895 [Delitschia confertaspora ATCC 74209]|uniref:Uncharacterized protein n=1 Tax=Delitschia confertaspora ATCC 74209 TaxID=1513339 RepID=A0A9P4JMD4_9PLEO|nr:hypothetical protein GQ43DRAFT_5895 [Delitschia confertaspora ATCC 74209]
MDGRGAESQSRKEGDSRTRRTSIPPKSPVFPGIFVVVIEAVVAHLVYYGKLEGLYLFLFKEGSTNGPSIYCMRRRAPALRYVSLF